MTRFNTNRKSLYLFAGSSLGTALISIAAALLVTTLTPVPMTTPDRPGLEQNWQNPSPRPHFRLSPIPAGADWIRS